MWTITLINLVRFEFCLNSELDFNTTCLFNLIKLSRAFAL